MPLLWTMYFLNWQGAQKEENNMNRQFFVFVKKEFAHVLRDRKTLLVLFGLPIVQIMIFGFALTNEVKNSRIVVMDQARDEVSQQLISRIEASRYFEVESSVQGEEGIEDIFRQGKVKMALIIPA